MNKRNAPTTTRLREALIALRSVGEEVVMAGEPIVIEDPDQLVLLPGAKEPIPAKAAIGMTADYTRKTQAIAEKERALTERETAAEQAIALLERLNADPFGTLASIQEDVLAYAKRANLTIPDEFDRHPEPKTAGSTTPPATPPGIDVTPLMAEVDKRLKGMEDFLNKFAAATDVNTQLNSLTQAHPDDMNNPDFRKRMAAVAERLPGAALDDIRRLAKFEDLEKTAAEKDDELKQLRRNLLLNTPDLGFSSRAPLPGGKPARDEEEEFRISFEKTLDTFIE